MMPTEVIYRVAANLRAALEKIDWEKMPANFRQFPKGTCGDISDILAEYLFKNGISGIEYVAGCDEQRHTHA